MGAFVTNLEKVKKLGDLHYLLDVVADADSSKQAEEVLKELFDEALSEAVKAVDFMVFMRHLYSELDD